MALEKAGHTCVAFCEIDKYARQTYKANFNTENEVEWNDITTITNEEIEEFGKKHDIQIICGGFPCQAFSITGKRLGFNEKRGTMFFEFMRFARILKPKYLFLENVKGLLNHENGETFKTILSTLDELGYDAEWQVFNSKDFGVPQNRERVFIIGHLRGECTRKIFPLERAGGKNPNKLKEITSGVSQGYRIYDASGVSTALASQAGGLGAKTGLYAVYLDKPFGEGSCSKYYIKREVSIASCLAARDFKGLKKNSTCITNFSYPIKNQNIENISEMRIRKLTPLECFRLQGFSDDFYYRARENGLSDTQLYRQAGNSVTVNVVYTIAKNFK